MRQKSLALLFSILMTLSYVAPIMAQETAAVYTVHINFFSYSCGLDSVEVSLYDQTGRAVGVTSSPDGGEVVISFRTLTSINSLTARAIGHASLGSYYSWFVSGSSTLTVGAAGDYWISVAMH